MRFLERTFLSLYSVAHKSGPPAQLPTRPPHSTPPRCCGWVGGLNAPEPLHSPRVRARVTQPECASGGEWRSRRRKSGARTSTSVRQHACSATSGVANAREGTVRSSVSLFFSRKETPMLQYLSRVHKPIFFSRKLFSCIFLCHRD